MSDNETMTAVLNKITQIKDPGCLREIHMAVFNRMRNQRQYYAQVATAEWSVGDKVQIHPEHRHKKPYDAIGTITKINKVKMKVDFGNFYIYTVPKTMLVKVS